ncbi:MAG: PKD domain-containing protein, partial [Halobacteriota archaeon]
MGLKRRSPETRMRQFLTVVLTLAVVVAPATVGLAAMSTEASAAEPYVSSISVSSSKIAPGQTLDVTVTICNNNYLQSPLGIEFRDVDPFYNTDGDDTIETKYDVYIPYDSGCHEYVFEDLISYSEHQDAVSDEGDDTLELQVTAEDNLGTLENLADQQVIGTHSAPSADFSYDPDPLNPGQTAIFSGSSSTDPDGDAIVEYEWDFDGDGTFEERGEQEGHSFDTEIDQTVTLRVTDEYGATDTVTKTVEMNNQPTADFEWTPESPEDPGDATGVSVELLGFYSDDSDGAVETYDWHLERRDGGHTLSPSGMDPTVTLYGGTYDVRLTVTDFDGGTDTVTKTLVVDEFAADITGLDAPDGVYEHGETVPATVEVENVGNAENTFFVGYSVRGSDGDWRDNGGETGETVTLSPGDSQSVDLSWAVPEDAPTGTYDAKVSLWKESDPDDLHTRLDSRTRADTFEVNSKPTADFSFTPTSPAAGQSVTFDASGSADPDGQIATYEWDFDGDGSVDTRTSSAETTHTFDNQGERDVTLTVVDNQGGTDSVTKQIAVEQAQVAPTASFTFSPSSPVEGDSVTFDASGSSDPNGDIQSYQWDFGDGASTDELSSPTRSHTYGTQGTYTVTLTVTDST